MIVLIGTDLGVCSSLASYIERNYEYKLIDNLVDLDNVLEYTKVVCLMDLERAKEIKETDDITVVYIRNYSAQDKYDYLYAERFADYVIDTTAIYDMKYELNKIMERIACR